MKTICHKTTGYFITLLFFVVMPAMGANAKTWNQAEVQQLADELVSAAHKLRIEARGHPGSNVGDRTAHLTALYDVRHFQTAAHQLSDAIEAGKGKPETQPIYAGLVEAMGGMKAYIQSELTSKWPPLEKALMKADGILTQLGAYYSS